MIYHRYYYSTDPLNVQAPSDQPVTQNLSPTAAAALASAAMHVNDRCAQHNGIDVVEVRAGFAQVRMTVRDYMVNGLEVCHGGYIFVLADTAMAHASNSHNQVALAASASIDWLLPGRLGDQLTASAKEQALNGRTGIYAIEVRDQHDQLIALFRGRTQQRRDTIVAGITIDSAQS